MQIWDELYTGSYGHEPGRNAGVRNYLKIIMGQSHTFIIITLKKQLQS